MKLEPATIELVDQLDERWKSQLDALEISGLKYVGAISRAREVIRGEHADNYAYIIINDAACPDGILLLSHACPRAKEGSWLKLLDVILAPIYSDVDQAPNLDELVGIASFILANAYELTGKEQHKSQELKICSDKLIDIKIWREVASKLPDMFELPFEMSSHGQWFVLKCK